MSWQGQHPRRDDPELSAALILLGLIRREYADLLAAARATLAAADEGESDALFYLRDELNPDRFATSDGAR